MKKIKKIKIKINGKIKTINENTKLLNLVKNLKIHIALKKKEKNKKNKNKDKW